MVAVMVVVTVPVVVLEFVAGKLVYFLHTFISQPYSPSSFLDSSMFSIFLSLLFLPFFLLPVFLHFLSSLFFFFLPSFPLVVSLPNSSPFLLSFLSHFLSPCQSSSLFSVLPCLPALFPPHLLPSLSSLLFFFLPVLIPLFLPSCLS